ncbi:MAG: tryptophan 2,3-dioxygenase family protein [Ilumatobacteraceae bacterium]
MATIDNRREVEAEVHTDFRDKMSYGSYLHLDRLLSAQELSSVPPHHDELLFIIQHQTTELWLKLMLHELRSARQLLIDDDLQPALKRLARVKHIQKSMTEQWSVLATLTPTEYAEFRGFLNNSSGFQSSQYRAVEFILGNKNSAMIAVFRHDPEAQAMLQEILDQTSVYDEFIRFLARRGHDIPPELIERDWTQPHQFSAALVEPLVKIYENPETNWQEYETCEELLDLEENFQLWRFRHVKTVERTIGLKRGTGGSSGVPFLRAALELTFFPEIYAVRTEIGQPR